MKNKKLRIINYMMPVLATAVVGIVYGSLPAEIPLQWSVDGTCSYGSKIQIWMMVGMMAVLAATFDVLPHIDPKRKNYEKFGRFYDVFCLLIQAVMIFVISIVISESFHPGRISVGKWTSVVIGALLMVIGNYMPKIKSNFYMGIKTPWTISNEEIWRKTHRLGGKMMFWAGLIMAGSMFILPEPAAFAWGSRR
ncbi:SdpI family protein [Clostridium sp. AM58-1XD]|uniref:SdpI family protein n=1 Tax=Clostridium sp. AM58-1XD TaxID=2292307 RepID=UPI000E52DA69|nr:SdpI family protein [Clostridium sp. AM58-1XD]RGY99652.1 DUF1648 domain-containing protein [Clostridium sp. AM58-1XD]